MAAREFASSVECGLKLSKRVYYGKDVPAPAPLEVPAMTRSVSSSATEGEDVEVVYIPAAPMVYAVVPEPEVVDNPDIPSYQPYVYGRCEPPALIPLHMHGVAMEIESFMDTAFVTVSGTWRVHCVTAGRSCDCRVAVPMGEQGSLLGVEVDLSGRSYRTELITLEDIKDIEKVAKAEDGRFLKCQIYTLKVPQVEGGSTLSIRISWSQKLIYNDGQFCLNVPFSFPAYVNPVGKKISKREKISLKVNSGTGREVLWTRTSHSLKELTSQDGKLSFLYEAQVPAWSSADFTFSYTITSIDFFGGVLLQSPFLRDFDQRDMFCFYLFPGNIQSRKVFRKEVVFLIDKSGSMKGDPLEYAKNALVASLSKLKPEDTFNIIAFNEEAMKLLANTIDSIPLIFLITDGSVEDEKEIFNNMKDCLKSGESICPRISTFGIDTINFRMQRLFAIASSVILADIKMDTLGHLDSLELFPSHIPDLSSGSPLIVSGRYDGSFPDTVKISGTLADMNSFVIDLKVQRAKDVPLDRVLARRHIDMLTAHAWLLGTEELEEKVAKMSIQAGVPSEYTRMTLVQIDQGKKAPEPVLLQEVYNILKLQKKVDLEGQKIIFLGKLGVGFGNLIATAKNIPPGAEKAKSSDPTELLVKAASNCCSQLVDRCCCMCCIQTCSYLNNQCAVVFTQLCTALACFECINCCYELCACF
uniref:VWFA domain-containing protein n=1 Tax=Fagus sylvatica TaxID=28930 RepID=A0A2N9IBF9_FAGSY